MDLDEYSRHLDGFGDALHAVDGAWEVYASDLMGTSQVAEDCVTLREAMLTPRDEQRFEGLLETSYFPHASRQRRLVRSRDD